MLRAIFKYILVIGALMLVPVTRTDVGKLHPVELISLSKGAGVYTIETDTGAEGEGKTVPEAVADLELTTPGVVYLDTAKYLIVTEQTQHEIEALRPYLKGDEQICLGKGEIRIRKAARYLAIHEPGVKVKQWQEGRKLPILRDERGKMQLEK